MLKDVRSAETPSLSVSDPETSAVDARWHSLVEQYVGLLHATIARVCPRHLGLRVDDIEQEARRKLWRALRAQGTAESPTDQVFQTAVRATIDAIRRARSRREEQWSPAQAARAADEGQWEVVDPQASPERRAERAAVLERVRTFLAVQKPDRRRALALHLQGFTTEEAGRLLGWSAQRARTLVHRGVHQLRDALGASGITHDVD